jgi:hypothetical protein
MDVGFLLRFDLEKAKKAAYNILSRFFSFFQRPPAMGPSPGNTLPPGEQGP